MQQINVNELKPHPMNDYLFDDITGENWDAFLESIKTSGVIEPVIATQNKILVSGHQRVRGCKELGINTIPCDIRIYDTDDKLLKDLIETNLRQRGIGNTNPIKLGRCIIELGRIYGIRNGSAGGNGSNQYSKELDTNNSDEAKFSQTDLANMIGISVDTLNNYKKLTELIPEVIDLVDTGIVTPTTALSIVKNMSQEEQEDFILSMDVTKKITQKQTQQYIDKIKELETKKPEVIEKVIDNTDYSSIEKNKKLQIELEKIKKEKEDLQSTNRLLEMSKKSSENISESYKKLSEEYKKQSEEYMKIKNKIINMGLDPNGEYNLYSAASEIAKLTNEIEDLLINKLAPIRYKNFMIALKNSNILRNNFKNTLDMVNDWYLSMNECVNSNLENENKNNVIDMEEI